MEFRDYFREYKETRDKIYLAYLEEKCHIHPTAEVIFKEDEDMENGNKAIFARIGGFDSGIRFTEGDILTWFIEQDIKPSEIKDYSGGTCIANPVDAFDKDFLDKVRKDAEEHPVQVIAEVLKEDIKPDVDAINKEIVDSLKKGLGTDVVLTDSEIHPIPYDTEIQQLIEERRRNGGGSFEYDGVVYNVDKDGNVTHSSVPRPDYIMAKDALKIIEEERVDEWFDAIKKGNPQRFG